MRPARRRRRSTWAAALVTATAALGVAPAYAYWMATGSASVSVTMATLGTPSVKTTTSGSDITIAVTALGDRSPKPDAFSALSGATPLLPCTSVPIAETCIDSVGVFAARREYTITNTLGKWHSPVATLTAYTAPPTPVITPDNKAKVAVWAPPAANGYAIEILVDDKKAKVGGDVPATGGLFSLSGLKEGSVVKATAAFRTLSATARFSVGSASLASATLERSAMQPDSSTSDVPAGTPTPPSESSSPSPSPSPSPAPPTPSESTSPSAG